MSRRNGMPLELELELALEHPSSADRVASTPWIQLSAAAGRVQRQFPRFINVAL